MNKYNKLNQVLSDNLREDTKLSNDITKHEYI